MGDEFKDQFRAAKAARTTGKLTKDQLKALKAQKAAAAAAAAAAQQQQEKAVVRDEDTKSMPPPPPRHASVPPPTTAPQKPSPAAGAGSYHPDSQGTRINDGGGITAASLLQSEPSVNKQTAPLHPTTNNNNNNNVSLTESNALPTGFFEATPVAAQGGQGSTGGPMSIDIVVSKAAKSGEGSTGAAFGGGGEMVEGGGGMRSGSAGGIQSDFLVATSQLSAMMETDPVAVGPAASRAIGASESQQHNTTAALNKNNNDSLEGGSGGGGGASSERQLPTGFFDSSNGTAPQGTKVSVAAGPAAGSKDVDMDKEFAEFMKEVDVDAPTEAQVVEEDDEEDEDARRARDDFEQFVRMERLREVKEAAATTGGTTQFVTALEEKPASALEIAGVVADDVLPPPKLVLPRKRKIAETVALLEKQDDGEDSNSDDEDSNGMVDWRAKKSMGK